MGFAEFFFAGLAAGAFTGLIPGIHSNTLISLAQANFPSLNGLEASLLFVSMAGAHAAFSALPAVFLFVPDPESALTLLPGHRLFLQGKGAHAIRLILFASVSSLAACVLLTPLILFLLPYAYPIVKPFLLPILACSSGYMLFSEKRSSLFPAAATFLLAGALGLLLFNSSVVPDPFLPCFCGFFAVSSIVTNLMAKSNRKPTTPKQPKKSPGVTRLLPFALLGVVLAACADMLPGIGSASQLAGLSAPLVIFSPEAFLVTVASTTISHAFLSMHALYSLGLARVGAAIAVKECIGDPSFTEFLLLASATFASISISCAIISKSYERVASFFSRLSLRATSTATLAFLLMAVGFFSGLNGLVILFTSTAIGLIPIFTGARRVHCMGLIILPTILYLAGV